LSRKGKFYIERAHIESKIYFLHRNKLFAEELYGTSVSVAQASNITVLADLSTGCHEILEKIKYGFISVM